MESCAVSFAIVRHGSCVMVMRRGGQAQLVALCRACAVGCGRASICYICIFFLRLLYDEVHAVQEVCLSLIAA